MQVPSGELEADEQEEGTSDYDYDYDYDDNNWYYCPLNKHTIYFFTREEYNFVKTRRPFQSAALASGRTMATISGSQEKLTLNHVCCQLL